MADLTGHLVLIERCACRDGYGAVTHDPQDIDLLDAVEVEAVPSIDSRSLEGGGKA